MLQHTECPPENWTQTYGKFQSLCMTQTQPFLSCCVQYIAPSMT